MSGEPGTENRALKLKQGAGAQKNSVAPHDANGAMLVVTETSNTPQPSQSLDFAANQKY